MKPHLRIPLIAFCAFSFSFLFFESFPGINWFLFHSLIVAASFVIDHQRISIIRLATAAALLVTSGLFVLNGSSWSFFVSFVWLFVFSGVTAEPHYRSMAVAILHSFTNIVMSYLGFLIALVQSKLGLGKVVARTFRFYYLVIPMIVIIVFIILYSVANPFFSEYLGVVGEYIGEFVRWVAELISPLWFWLTVLGFILSIFMLMPGNAAVLKHYDLSSTDWMQRKRIRFQPVFGLMGLKNEHRAAVVLFAILSLILAFFNILDLYHVWFNFEWNGEYLKQFVHEGTWLLILSIVLSMALVLFFFRGNLNFYSKSKTLKFLVKVWLAQNAFLALSVVVRNLHYIDYFSLAYKRIAVMFFLATVLFGLFTVYLKVQHKKSPYYLLRLNTISILSALTISAFVNWDVFITKYNFAHHESGYIHFDFLAQMSPAAFEHMDFDLQTLEKMEESRNARYPLETSYMTAAEFYAHMQSRMEIFEEAYAEKHWKEWRLSDAQAHHYVVHRTN